MSESTISYFFVERSIGAHVASADGFPQDAATVAGMATFPNRISEEMLGACQRSKSGLRAMGKILQRLGKALHVHDNGITQEQLPRRWVELIRHLDEQERRRSQDQPPAASPEVSARKA